MALPVSSSSSILIFILWTVFSFHDGDFISWFTIVIPGSSFVLLKATLVVLIASNIYPPDQSVFQTLIAPRLPLFI